MCLDRPVIDKLSVEVQEYITSLETDLEEQKNRIADLEIMLQNMQRMLFGKKSEKLVPQVPEAAGEQLSRGCGQNPGPGFAPSRSVMAPSQVCAYNQEDLILQATS